MTMKFLNKRNRQPKTGYWIRHPERICEEDECSVCHGLFKVCRVVDVCTTDIAKYCPWCGAKMRY